MNLRELQAEMYAAVTQPLTAHYDMQQTSADGRHMQDVAAQFIKPNDRLTAFERLEIYNRQYWYRVLDSLEEDFPGLLAITGRRKFDALAKAYIIDNPSRSFTLRDLGSNLEMWLRAHPQYIAPREALALDMVSLEWAEIEVFDAAECPVLLPNLGGASDPDPVFHVQPFLKLLELHYPVDELLVSIKSSQRENETASNAVAERVKRGRVHKIARQKPQTIFLAVHRQDDSVYLKRLEKEAFRCLAALRDGKRLSEAVTSALDGSAVEEQGIPALVSGWFEQWSAQGWFAQPATAL